MAKRREEEQQRGEGGGGGGGRSSLTVDVPHAAPAAGRDGRPWRKFGGLNDASRSSFGNSFFLSFFFFFFFFFFFDLHLIKVDSIVSDYFLVICSVIEITNVGSNLCSIFLGMGKTDNG
ncbi:hypothetical protein BRADI_4g17304v3 [Brachypodium distachyon]|uniref:Uncharacterized protein n=1 Tax=Brachypodium distachyon TaxID=15368 RepID=A0A2K2CNG3_BRADI|nr:hypothetical protein BRADI_4g17304v3 [Brachypodium distachyon]